MVRRSGTFQSTDSTPPHWKEAPKTPRDVPLVADPRHSLRWLGNILVSPRRVGACGWAKGGLGVSAQSGRMNFWFTLETFYDCSSVNFDFLVCLPVHSFFLNSSLVSVFMTSVNLVSVFSISCTSFTSRVFSNSLVVLSSSNYVPISLQCMLIYAVFPLLPLYLFGFTFMCFCCTFVTF